MWIEKRWLWEVPDIHIHKEMIERAYRKQFGYLITKWLVAKCWIMLEWNRWKEFACAACACLQCSILFGCCCRFWWCILKVELHLLLLRVGLQRAQIAEEALRREDVRRADDYLPVFDSVRHFIRGAHFGVAHAADDEYQQTWYVFHSLLAFVFVPVTVTRAIDKRIM